MEFDLSIKRFLFLPFCSLQMEDLILVKVGPRVEAYLQMDSKCNRKASSIKKNSFSKCVKNNIAVIT